MEALDGEELTQKVMMSGCKYIIAWGVRQTEGGRRAGRIVFKIICEVSAVM